MPGFILYLPIKVKHHVFSTEVQKIWVRSWWQIDIPIFGSHHFLKNFHTWCGHFTSQHGWIRLIGCQILPVGHETRILLGVCGWVPTLLVNNINLVYIYICVYLTCVCLLGDFLRILPWYSPSSFTTIWENMFGSLFPFASWPCKSKIHIYIPAPCSRGANGKTLRDGEFFHPFDGTCKAPKLEGLGIYIFMLGCYPSKNSVGNEAEQLEIP